MLIDLVKHVEAKTGLPQLKARAALGIVLNAADRQGSSLSEQVFNTVPGARTLSAKTGSEIGAATGEIARLIEKTPGGRRHVNAQMMRALHSLGLGHSMIGQLLPAITAYMLANHDLDDFGHLGDMFGADTKVTPDTDDSIAA